MSDSIPAEETAMPEPDAGATAAMVPFPAVRGDRIESGIFKACAKVFVEPDKYRR